MIDLQFRIDQASAEIYVNSISAPLTTPIGLAPNIGFVSFAKGAGQIIYNDRPPIAELFSDPSPYQSYINQWITVLSQLSVNPLTLAQAQAVKCALVNAVYAIKRAAPVTVTVGATPYQWDASDVAVGRMVPLASMAYISDVNTVVSDADTKISAMLSSIDSEMATLVTAIDTNVGDHNSAMSAYTTFVSNLQTNLNTWVGHLNTTEVAAAVGNWADPGNMTVPSAGSPPNMSNVSWPSISFTNISSLTIPTLQLLPSGGSALVTLQPSDVKAIMQAIAAQYAAKALINSQKQAAVNALTIMQDVISYDATTGW